jgi:acyl dehydratase
MSREIDARETRFGRYLEDFQVGDVYKHWPGKTITEADDHLFCMITMNHHPLHTDAHYAETETQFGKNVVVGNLVYSLVLGMSVPDVSGKAIANLEVESLKHAKPTFHGDTIYAQTTVVDVALETRPRGRHRGHDRDEPARRRRVRVPAQGARAEAQPGLTGRRYPPRRWTLPSRSPA